MTQPGMTQTGYDPNNFYVWRASADFAIHLSLKVVTQLSSEISRAGTDGQGGELRGILLGRTVDTPFRTTFIEDFRLIPANADPGANPESDNALFEIACRMGEAFSEQRAIGFFRSRRNGRLNLGQRDLETFSRVFCETGKVALLIQTSTRGNENDATLFYWQHGGPYPRDFGFGLPFDAGQLMGGHPGWRYPDPLDQTPTPAAAPPKPKAPQVTLPAPRPYSPSKQPIKWSGLLPTAALIVIGLVALQVATNSKQPAVSAAAPSVETSLGLTVTSRPHQLEIRWNRESEAIAASEHGTMRITEAGVTEAVPFDQQQLHDGYVAYTPTTNDVSIRLEVTGKDGGTTSESIRSVAIP
jgi:hypothetical protein